MRTLVVVLSLVLLTACQTNPPTPDPDPDPEPLAVSFRTYYATGGGAQSLMFEDILANRAATVTIYAACTIDDGGPALDYVWYEGAVDLQTQGSDRAIPRQSVSVDAGPGTIDCSPITATAGGEDVPITER